MAVTATCSTAESPLRRVTMCGKPQVSASARDTRHRLCTDVDSVCAAEGDWIILMLQTARFLMRALQRARKGKKTQGPIEYLSPLRDAHFDLATAQTAQPLHAAVPREAADKSVFHDIGYLLGLYRFRALLDVAAAGDDLQRRVMEGMPFDEAWNACALQLVQATRSHCMLLMLSQFAQAAQNVAEEAVRNALRKLCVMFALSFIVDEQWAGIAALKGEQMRMVRVVCSYLPSHKLSSLNLISLVLQLKAALVDVMSDLRPDVIALTDAFDFPDRVLASTLGR